MTALTKKMTFVLLLLFSSYVDADLNRELYFIDAHSQIDHDVKGVDVVLKQMDANNVRTTLLSTRGKRSWQDVLDWSSYHPTRIAPLVRSKGKHYQDNTPRYYKNIHKQIETQKFIGGAEILVFHAQKGHKAPQVAVDLDDERISLILKESLHRGWPIIIHIEFASLDGRERQQHIDALKSLLRQYPDHEFVLIHMGQLPHTQVNELIKRHPNAYFLTSHTDPVTIKDSSQPWLNLFSPTGYHFKEHWKNLFIAHPDRFIFALDNVWSYHWSDTYGEKMEYWRKALSELPENTAHLIAHGNAERLWKIK